MPPKAKKNSRKKKKGLGEALADWFTGGTKGKAPGSDAAKHRRRSKIKYGKVPF